MKRLTASLVLAVMLGTAVPIVAQNTSTQTGYTVKEGDSLWKIAGHELNDPTQWQSIINRNYFLREPGRQQVRHNGWTYVMIRPGERLQGLDQFGNLLPQQSVAAVESRTAETGAATSTSWWNLPWVSLALFALIVCALLLWSGIRHMLRQDPATSGPPQVPGGVTEETARQRFEAMGTMQRFTILDQVAGRAFGTVSVSYANGRSIPRTLNDEPAFRARVRHDNGAEEELYMLQRCGNDLRFGGISRYIPGSDFRFEADRVDEPSPVPTMAPAQPLPSIDSTPAPAAPSEVPADDGTIIIELKRASADQPNMLRLKGVDVDDFTLTLGARVTTLRFTESTI